jgi:hypothetical protein
MREIRTRGVAASDLENSKRRGAAFRGIDGLYRLHVEGHAARKALGRGISRLADVSPVKLQGQIKAWEAGPGPGAVVAPGAAATVVVAACAFAPIVAFVAGAVALPAVFLRR